MEQQPGSGQIGQATVVPNHQDMAIFRRNLDDILQLLSSA